MAERLTTPRALPDDRDTTLRPESFDEFVGQAQIKEQLAIFVEAAKKRGDALDHVLLSGPPGLGKTTLARIIAKELAAGMRSTSAPVVERAGDLAAILTAAEPRDIVFIDEIHRLRPVIEEILYPAMEDFHIDVLINSGPGAQSVKLGLKRFTLIGATTRPGALTGPLLSRFGINLRLGYYSAEELEKISERSARILEIPVDDEGRREMASRSRGTPRVVNRILRRVRDYAQVRGSGRIDGPTARAALEMLQVDAMGLDAMDRQYISVLVGNYGGGPVGVGTLAASLSEEAETLEDVVEPYLIQIGFIQRTSRGRQAARHAFRHVGVKPNPQQGDLFE